MLTHIIYGAWQSLGADLVSYAPASQGQLAAYLRRIGFTRPPAADLATLRAIHRRHAETIAYENFDVHLGQRVTRDPQDAFDKIVTAGRGGWCFEQNGLLAWMLEAIGFRVTRLAGAVMRETAGDRMTGNHLVLLVELDETWVADVGLGNGLVEPVPFVAGPFRQRFMDYALVDLGDGWWRFRNHEGNLPASFDFSPTVADPALLDESCSWLQSDPGSPFVQNAIAQRHHSDRTEMIVGTLHTTFSKSGTTQRVIADADDYLRTLDTLFGLRIPELAALWPRIEARGTANFAPEQETV